MKHATVMLALLMLFCSTTLDQIPRTPPSPEVFSDTSIAATPDGTIISNTTSALTNGGGADPVLFIPQ